MKPEGRDFTAIQQRIIKTVVDRSLADLERAWQAVLPANVQYLRSESNPQFAMVVSIPEIVMAVLFRVDFGDSGHDLFVVYPYAMIEPIKEKLYAGFFSDHLEQDSGWATRFRESLQECAVRMNVQLGTSTLRVRDVLNFRRGDVLVLDQSPGDLMLSSVEGLPKFMGQAGVLKGSRAFRIVQLIGSANADGGRHG